MASKLPTLCVMGVILAVAQFSPLATVCAVQTPAMPAQQSAAVKTTLFKQTPEDTGTWRREPFRNVPDAKTTSTTVPGKTKSGSLPGILSKSGINPAPELVLQGIMKSGEHYYAIINGRTVKAGDHIGAYTISRIDRHRTTVKDSTGSYILDIYQGRINRGTP